MSTAETPPTPADRPAWRPVALGAVVVAAIVLLVVVLRGGSDEAPRRAVAGAGATGPAAPAAVAESAAALAKRSARLGRDIYWVGPSDGRTYEVTQTADGSVYVRYLESGVAVGDPRPNFTTVGTYPQSNPFKTVTDAAEREGAQTEQLAKGGLAVTNASRPNSWYLAYPDAKELIEVFSPKAARARALVRDGRVVPVER